MRALMSIQNLARFAISAFVLALVFQSLTACTGGRSNQPINDFESVLAGSGFSCGAESCPDSVGLLVSVEPFSSTVGQCTATLIAPDLLVTASHCISNDMRIPSINCADHLGFVSAGKANQPHHVRCKRIVHSSPFPKPREYLTGPDYAFIQLDQKIPVSVVEKVSRDGLGENEDYHYFGIDPTQSAAGVSGINKKKICKSKMNSKWAPEFTDPRSTKASLFGSDCKALRGNSGAALRAKGGEIVGIVAVGEAEKGRQIRAGILAPYGKIPASVSVASNLMCAEIPLDIPVPSVCKLNRSASFEKEILNKRKLDTELRKKLIEIYYPQLPQMAEWVPVVTEYEDRDQELRKHTSYQISFRPVCLRKEADARTLSTSKELQFSAPVLRSKVMTRPDEFSRTEVQIELSAIDTTQFSVPIVIEDEVKLNGKLSYQDGKTHLYGNGRSQNSYSIDFCRADQANAFKSAVEQLEHRDWNYL